MQAAEIELKFSVDDVSKLRAAIAGAGFRLKTERSFESNTLYDTEDRQLRGRKQILRLRNYAGRCVLTHKRQPSGSSSDTRYKTRLESESEVEDCAALAEIFTQLGYGPVQLGVGVEQCSTESYGKMFLRWKEDTGSPAENLTFDEVGAGVLATATP
jgi:adenylate cyclase class 2